MTEPSPGSGRAQRPQIVIVGGGFGGLSAARGLAGADAEVTLVDRHNHHLFQPLLYQVATASLSPADIASPIRTILRGATNIEVLMGEVVDVDVARREVRLDRGKTLGYDHLVLATGAGPSYFGHDDWQPMAPGLKSLADALDIRERLLLAFERAECEDDPAERRRLTTVLVIGAGPTGVELAGAIAELGRRGLDNEFRRVDAAETRVILVEAGLKALPAFPDRLSAEAVRSLQRLGVEVRLGSPVREIGPAGALIGDERVEAAVIVWAAGVAATPVARWLGTSGDRAGRVAVEADLTFKGHPEISIIGDVAVASGPDGRPLPGLAPVATQQGTYVAKRIRALLSGVTVYDPFVYRDRGNLATIGRNFAVADLPAGPLGRIRIDGFVGWLLWSLVHVYFLIGFRNRVVVALSWLWSYATRRSGARLVTGRAAPAGVAALDPADD
jgi:NADH dehydrogenase